MKLCKSCKAPIDDHVKFCKSCGAPVSEENITEQQSSAALESQSHPQPEQHSQQAESKKTKIIAFMKKPIFIIGLLLLIGGGVTAAILLNKSPKELYLLSEYNSIKESMAGFEDTYGDALKFQEQTLEKPSQTEFKVSGGFTQESAVGDPDYDMFQELLSSSSIEAKVQQDPTKEQAHYELALNIENEKAIDAELYQSKNQLGFKVPALYDKFLYFNHDQFGKLMRKMDPYYTGPEKLELSNLELRDLKLTEEESEYLSDRYTGYVLDALKDENFELKKDVNFEFKGEEMKLRSVTLSLDEKEVKAFLNGFIDQLIKDDKLHSILIKRIEIVADAAAVAEETEQFDKKEMKEEMVDSLKEMKEDLDEISFPDGFKSTLLIDKDEQIVDRDTKFAVAMDGEQANAAFTTKNVPYQDDKEWNEWKIEVSPKEEGSGNKLALQYTNDVQKQKEDRTEDMQVKVMLEEYGEPEELLFKMNSVFKGVDGKQEINREFGLESDSPEYVDLTGFKGEIKQVSDVNLKKEYSEDKITVMLDIKDEYDPVSLSFNLETKTTLKDNLKFPDLTADSNTSMNVVEASEDELATIIEEISMGIFELGTQYGLIPEQDYYYEDDMYYEADDTSGYDYFD